LALGAIALRSAFCPELLELGALIWREQRGNRVLLLLADRLHLLRRGLLPLGSTILHLGAVGLLQSLYLCALLLSQPELTQRLLHALCALFPHGLPLLVGLGPLSPLRAPLLQGLSLLLGQVAAVSLPSAAPGLALRLDRVQADQAHGESQQGQ